MRWLGGSHFAQPPEALIVTERRWHCLGTGVTSGLTAVTDSQLELVGPDSYHF